MESTGIILRQEGYEPLTTKGSELTFEDLDNNFIKIYQDLFVHDQFLIEQNTALQATGTVIDFEKRKIFNTSLLPASGNITNDLTDPKLGVVQKIYHQHTSAPTFPAGWVLVQGTYMPNTLNIIYAEFSESTRVEYQIFNSATNGLTIGLTSIAGGGNGRILFQSGANLQQSPILFYDNTNGRLGVGQTTPGARFDAKILGALSTDLGLRIRNSADTGDVLCAKGNGNVQVGVGGLSICRSDSPNGSLVGTFTYKTDGTFGSTLPITLTKIVSPTYAASFVQLDGSVIINQTSGSWADAPNAFVFQSNGAQGLNSANNNFVSVINGGTSLFVVKALGNVGIGTSTINASAKVQIDSTTQGLLVPRMTTTQKNAIASPAAGLQVYDTTTNKLCCYNGTSWFDLY